MRVPSPAAAPAFSCTIALPSLVLTSTRLLRADGRRECARHLSQTGRQAAFDRVKQAAPQPVGYSSFRAGFHRRGAESDWRLSFYIPRYTIQADATSGAVSRRSCSPADNTGVHALGKVKKTEEKKMPAKQVTRYDAEEFLKNNTGVVAYLNAALEDGDPSLVSAAPSDIARARNMAQRLQAQRRARFSPTQHLRRHP
ncbi:helix-turn-helix domain-containing transcriptional regulator [Parafannyhessea umbonata]|uniref:helix-turn-helix domain-containing transcriptional regulator n=2 Tax=Parafannyhessea umbonata TaxID=604330 RepID=UPI00359CA628